MSHRSLLVSAVAVISLLVLAPPADARRRIVAPAQVPFSELYSEGGYANLTSVPQGGAIRFHIATSVSPFTVEIVNLADHTTVIRQIANLQSRPQDCSGQYGIGCGWDVTATLDVGHDWPSGYYAARFPTRFGTRNIIFVVRAAQPGFTSKMLIVSPTHTYQAYNEFGGKSLYPSNSPARSTVVSYDRPYHQDSGLGRFDFWERRFVDWLRETNRRYEVATDVDLEDPTLLANYNVVVIVGHSEYWTASARENLETFSRNGGHIAIFGGNTMWWQARLEDGNRTLVAHKDARLDPTRFSAPSTVTTHWFEHPVNNPENFIVGTSFRHGGYANTIGAPENLQLLPVEQRVGFTVTNAGHWVFAGAGVTKGTEFGREAVGAEVDGVLFNCDANGDVIGPDGSDGTPRNFRILAVTPASSGHGTLGIYVNSAGGAVFNAATQNWAQALQNDPVVRAITANVLNEFESGRRQPFDPVASWTLTEDRFNCPHESLTAVPGWRANGGQARITAACAYEGAAGLELSGSRSINLARRLNATGEPRDHVEVRFYVNVDAFERRGQFPAPIVTLQNRVENQRSQVALVEVDLSNGTRRLRLARRGPDGAFAPGEWIDVGSGWHLVEVTWRSPGSLVFQVDGTTRTLDNPHANQLVNELVVEYPSSQTGDAGRVCIDAIAAGSERLGPVAALVAVDW